MEVRATGGEEEDESPWQWWWAAPGLGVQSSTSLYPAFQPPTLVSIWKKKRESRVFFKISPLAFSIPLLNANANVNTNTLIKNMWEENANLLFCNPPQGARCYTETNTKKSQHTVWSTDASKLLIILLNVFFQKYTEIIPVKILSLSLRFPFFTISYDRVNQTRIIRAAR